MLHVGGLQPTILGFPFVVGGRTDPVLLPDLVDGEARIDLLQNRYDLRLGELRLARGKLLGRVTIVPESSPFGLPTFQGSARTTI